MKKDYIQKIKLEIKNLKNFRKYIIIEILIILGVIALDMLTKTFVYQAAVDAGKINIIKGVISFYPTENTGASFGMFGESTLMLTIVSFVSSTVIFFVLIFSEKERNPVLRAALIMIFAGAVGNLIDRMWLGYVRDFIYFELIDFAIFNVADSSLCIGTGLLVIFVIFFYKDKDAEAKRLAKKNAKYAAPEASATEVNAEEGSSEDLLTESADGENGFETGGEGAEEK